MLTLPAEPRPQTGLMDSLPAVAPSFVRCGVSGSRRSPRKNHVTERRDAQKPYGKPTASPTRKPRPSPPTAQMELGVPSRLERTPGKQAPCQEQLNFSVAPETIHDKLRRPPISPRVSSLNRTVPCHGVTSDPSRAATSDSAPKGWVIGPLFQSFRSKMASFTEIVMSPVKLFKSNSTESEAPPNEPESADESRCTSAEDRVGSAERGNQLTDLQKSEEDEVDVLRAEVDDVVPWRTPETELEALVTQSASDTVNATAARHARHCCYRGDGVQSGGGREVECEDAPKQNHAPNQNRSVHRL
ncbi:uncharacterized protein LOC129408682 [Boleophthalmus pectinirostris]|uniref:uncharacterized protein LOC129408682 n=1 Tax=Boleophthalmus pectinirostris TaxID=150288 RepID=UPI002432352E|nr:uncharacterized protein LOC129408682 [Boleophthalmus pectinirostris]